MSASFSVGDRRIRLGQGFGRRRNRHRPRRGPRQGAGSHRRGRGVRGRLRQVPVRIRRRDNPSEYRHGPASRRIDPALRPFPRAGGGRSLLRVAKGKRGIAGPPIPLHAVRPRRSARLLRADRLQGDEGSEPGAEPLPAARRARFLRPARHTLERGLHVGRHRPRPSTAFPVAAPPEGRAPPLRHFLPRPRGGV